MNRRRNDEDRSARESKTSSMRVSAHNVNKSPLTCLILSLVTRKCFPISSNVMGLPSARPNLISMICASLEDRSSMVRLSSLLTLVLSFTLEGWAAWDTNRSLTYTCIALCGVVKMEKRVEEYSEYGRGVCRSWSTGECFTDCATRCRIRCVVIEWFN